MCGCLYPESTTEDKKVILAKSPTIESNIPFTQEKSNEIFTIEDKEINLEVIHVSIIDSTMPSSRKYIDEGNKLPFIYNTDIQTSGTGKGKRKWAGLIKGNLYTSTCIPISMIKNEINNNDVLVKITAISIYQEIIKLAEKEFYLKYPNDIICKDKKKIGGIIVEYYKDFIIIGFGINIVDKPDDIRKGGLPACFIKEHLPADRQPPTALDLSIQITKRIFSNINLNEEEVFQLFEKCIKTEE